MDTPYCPSNRYMFTRDIHNPFLRCFRACKESTSTNGARGLPPDFGNRKKGRPGNTSSADKPNSPTSHFVAVSQELDTATVTTGPEALRRTVKDSMATAGLTAMSTGRRAEATQSSSRSGRVSYDRGGGVLASEVADARDLDKRGRRVGGALWRGEEGDY